MSLLIVSYQVRIVAGGVDPVSIEGQCPLLSPGHGHTYGHHRPGGGHTPGLGHSHHVPPGVQAVPIPPWIVMLYRGLVFEQDKVF